MSSFYLSDPIASDGGVRADRIPRLLLRSIAFSRERLILVLHYGGFDRRRKDNTRADEVIVVDKRQKQRRLDAISSGAKPLEEEIRKQPSVADHLGSTASGC
jgi:hypothetical protein